jgi:hypothetical protein
MGNQAIYQEAAKELAQYFIDNDLVLVYGGANVGLMKILADTMLEAGKEVIGVMPRHLIEKEVAHNSLSEMIEVESMAQRKDLMIQMSDAFIAMPGGFGTLDEIAEVLVLDQLQIIEKPMGLLNTNHYFDHLIKYFELGVAHGFVRQEHLNNLFYAEKTDDLISKMQSYQPVGMAKWLKDIKTESR